eukprot:TRINITY_DN30668_c0_g1_i1.p1 TRINITY_DN30668_c0_g1~~TRINITY_DN30668_c0_g1_i1.p1  ORF type:complete len:864 (-),score=189.19 TRINITY_DN30668_c0_g1_i1:1637-4207(-)
MDSDLHSRLVVDSYLVLNELSMAKKEESVNEFELMCELEQNLWTPQLAFFELRLLQEKMKRQSEENSKLIELLGRISKFADSVHGLMPGLSRTVSVDIRVDPFFETLSHLQEHKSEDLHSILVYSNQLSLANLPLKQESQKIVERLLEFSSDFQSFLSSCCAISLDLFTSHIVRHDSVENTKNVVFQIQSAEILLRNLISEYGKLSQLYISTFSKDQLIAATLEDFDEIMTRYRVMYQGLMEQIRSQSSNLLPHSTGYQTLLFFRKIQEISRSWYSKFAAADLLRRVARFLDHFSHCILKCAKLAQEILNGRDHLSLVAGHLLVAAKSDSSQFWMSFLHRLPRHVLRRASIGRELSNLITKSLLDDSLSSDPVMINSWKLDSKKFLDHFRLVHTFFDFRWNQINRCSTIDVITLDPESGDVHFQSSWVPQPSISHSLDDLTDQKMQELYNLESVLTLVVEVGFLLQFFHTNGILIGNSIYQSRSLFDSNKYFFSEVGCVFVQLFSQNDSIRQQIEIECRQFFKFFSGLLTSVEDPCKGPVVEKFEIASNFILSDMIRFCLNFLHSVHPSFGLRRDYFLFPSIFSKFSESFLGENTLQFELTREGRLEDLIVPRSINIDSFLDNMQDLMVDMQQSFTNHCPFITGISFVGDIDNDIDFLLQHGCLHQFLLKNLLSVEHGLFSRTQGGTVMPVPISEIRFDHDIIGMIYTRVGNIVGHCLMQRCVAPILGELPQIFWDYLLDSNSPMNENVIMDMLGEVETARFLLTSTDLYSSGALSSSVNEIQTEMFNLVFRGREKQLEAMRVGFWSQIFGSYQSAGVREIAEKYLDGSALRRLVTGLSIPNSWTEDFSELVFLSK